MVHLVDKAVCSFEIKRSLVFVGNLPNVLHLNKWHQTCFFWMNYSIYINKPERKSKLPRSLPRQCLMDPPQRKLDPLTPMWPLTATSKWPPHQNPMCSMLQCVGRPRPLPPLSVPCSPRRSNLWRPLWTSHGDGSPCAIVAVAFSRSTWDDDILWFSFGHLGYVRSASSAACLAVDVIQSLAGSGHLKMADGSVSIWVLALWLNSWEWTFVLSEMDLHSAPGEYQSSFIASLSSLNLGWLFLSNQFSDFLQTWLPSILLHSRILFHHQ